MRMSVLRLLLCDIWSSIFTQAGDIPLFLAINSNNQGAARELLRYQVEQQLDYRKPITGDTALHLAIGKKRDELVRFMLGKGASVNTFNVSTWAHTHVRTRVLL